MKTIRGRDGRDQLWFGDGEIEEIIEAELRNASMVPSIDSPALNLELFIERHLGARLDQYVEMEAALLGFTEFFGDHPPRVSINAQLTGSALDEDETEPGIRGRFRATLAHEAAHVVLHRSFVERGARNMELFGEEPTARRALHRCPKSAASFRRVVDWREWQANQGMAALLMPRVTFVELARREIAAVFPGRTDVPEGQEHRIIPALAGLFEVSKQAAAIRLETLRLLSRGQSTLA
ncbi:MAG TPA: ImmA/IrrE family metallo-endopeptidase [Polyangia bacterium]|nr:ImmA/IrrE family metallo-endopeptidase [Polyangia bacterium]